MKKPARIAVTGIGPLSSGGSGKDEVWDSVMGAKTGLVHKEYRIGRESIGKFFLHEIGGFNIDDYNIDRRSLDEMRAWKEGDEIEDIYYFLAVIRMAIDDSGIEIDDKNGRLTGLMLAHENIGHGHFYDKIIDEMSFIGEDAPKRPSTKKGFLEAFYKAFKRTGYELQAFMPLYHIAKIFGIHGYSLMINNACASGLYAIEAAAGAIRSGQCERMIVAAVDKSNVFKQIWFEDVKMLSRDGRTKPFASGRDGFAIGDGGAALVLESMECAKERKARIYAEYVGSSFVMEGWKVTFPDVSGDSYKNMISDAITASGVDPDGIDLIVPHGIGTKITDEYEARAIAKVFGDKKSQPLITALKPYTGHTLGSTALLETAIMMSALENGCVPATLNCEDPDDSLPVSVVRQTKKAKSLKIALKTSCGFAGFDGACVFQTIGF